MKAYEAEELLTSRTHKGNYLQWIAKVFSDMGLVMPYVKDGRGTRVARGGKDMLNLPRWARTELTILHEIAHHLLWKYDCTPQKRAHGKLFRDLLIDLVEWHIGPNKAAELRWAYNKVYKHEKY